MAVNGAGSASADVWVQTVSVSPATRYQFSAFVANLFLPESTPDLGFYINGVRVGTLLAPSELLVWDLFSVVWDSGTAATATIAIRDEATDTGGNDFGLDDLALVSAGPDPTQCTATSSGGAFLACPAGDVSTLASVPAAVEVHVRTAAGTPMDGFPASDVWLAAVDAAAVSFCEPGLTADDASDSNGRATISGTPRGGGCTQGGLVVVVGGQVITGSSPLQLAVNSPDRTADLRVDLADIGPFSAALNGSYSFCADFYRDGRIDLVDVAAMSAHLGHVCP